MEIRKNWFTYIYLTVFSICMSYSLFSGILNIGVSSKYPFLWYGGALIAMGGLWLIANTFAFMFSHFIKFKTDKHSVEIVIETLIVVIVLIAAAAARIWVIRNMPMQPEQDYGTYYKVAGLLANGKLTSEGAWYCDYISQFPHVIGYPYILSRIFLIFGTSVSAGLYFNMVLSLISIFLVYRIARRICGRVGGLLSLVITAFWPSQILYINQMASEPLFTCMILVSILISAYLFSYSIRGKAVKILVLNIILGINLALAGAVRPVSIILLIAIIICTITYKGKTDEENLNPGLIKSCMLRGWIRAGVIVIVYLLLTRLVSSATERTIERELPGSTVSFGYNLMVGLNIEAKGSWNLKDSEFLSEKFKETGSAAEAHLASREVAVGRLLENPAGIANLAFEKYTFLWDNDDYGAFWNLLLMEKQKNLTAEKRSLLNELTVWNNVYYLLFVFLSLLSGIFLWFRKKVGVEHILILYFIGTALLHMVLENQNRYHYSVLPVLTILSSVGLVEIFRFYIRKTEVKIEKVIKADLEEAAALLESDTYRNQDKAPDNSFDMLEAIKNGHITVTVTEAYLKQSESKSD